jgi:hypothetical protein
MTIAPQRRAWRTGAEGAIGRNEEVAHCSCRTHTRLDSGLRASAERIDTGPRSPADAVGRRDTGMGSGTSHSPAASPASGGRTTDPATPGSWGAPSSSGSSGFTDATGSGSAGSGSGSAAGTGSGAAGSGSGAAGSSGGASGWGERVWWRGRNWRQRRQMTGRRGADGAPSLRAYRERV